MNDIITAIPITPRRFSVPQQRSPKHGISAAFETLFLAICDAYCSVYAAPFNTHRRGPRVVSDEDLNGRDPSW